MYDIGMSLFCFSMHGNFIGAHDGQQTAWGVDDFEGPVHERDVEIREWQRLVRQRSYYDRSRIARLC
ncbi:hypothetical protein KUV51_00405 [Tateyamaria omphalii]|uniref:hypothetical protein n=1 Tax=Tateyamaria omphalii TaxID=299262 RepID=UPI001C9A1172|nr:hypothetical protein [Tateyamaria omphalii]MBY5931442.1 hypothetical protein [Tateyamaria omphalii]